MKVAHHSDYDTHAVIGGNDVKEFAISQTAEFFTVLSSALYSNKPLAVIREILCNAWDAHIEAGLTNVAINVTVDYDNLIIRDYGLGIHPDLMHPIYCVYGSSTKENDGRQTGGFGLGSKAPFAYSDHFTVTSWHGGLKTVYAISRGSALTQGKPDLRVMVQTADIEQGLEVKIPIKENKDVGIFEHIIGNIASYGEMNVTLNGTAIKPVPVSSAEKNIFITEELPYESNDICHIRYGNVLYPVPEHAEYKSQIFNIKETIKNLGHGSSYYRTSWRLIMQAPPNSISVTPSRESLSLTDTTIETLTKLLNDVNKEISTQSSNFSNIFFNIEKEYEEEQWRDMTPHKLAKFYGKRKRLSESGVKYFNSIKQIAQHMFDNNLGITSESINRINKMRIDSLIQGGWRRKSMLLNMYKILDRNKGKFATWGTGIYKDFRKLILQPLIRNMVKNNISYKSLYITHRASDRASIHGVGFFPVNSYKGDVSHQMDLLHSVVVFTHSKTTFVNSYSMMGYISQVIYPLERALFVFVAPRKLEVREEAKAFFVKSGFLVIDFYDWYEKNYVPEVDPTTVIIPKPPRPEGIPALSNNVQGGAWIKNGYRNPPTGQELVRIKNPELIFKADALNARYNPRFFSFGDGAAIQINRQFGQRSGIVANELQWDKLISLGSKDGEIVIADEVITFVENSTNIRDYLTTNIDSLGFQADTIMEIGKHSLVINSICPPIYTLTDKEKDYFQIFQHLERESYPGRDGWKKRVKDVWNTLCLIPKAPAILAFEERIKRNQKRLNVIDMHLLKIAIMNSSDAYTKTYAEICIINALKD